jgi:hypothetical protein
MSYEKISISDKRIEHLYQQIQQINNYYGKIRIFTNLPIIKGKEDMYYKDFINNENIYINSNNRVMIKIRKGKVFGTLQEVRVSYGKLLGIYLKSINKDLKSQQEKFAYFRKVFVLETNAKQENHHPNGHELISKEEPTVKTVSQQHHHKIHGGM